MLKRHALPALVWEGLCFTLIQAYVSSVNHPLHVEVDSGGAALEDESSEAEVSKNQWPSKEGDATGTDEEQTSELDSVSQDANHVGVWPTGKIRRLSRNGKQMQLMRSQQSSGSSQDSRSWPKAWPQAASNSPAQQPVQSSEMQAPELKVPEKQSPQMQPTAMRSLETVSPEIQFPEMQSSSDEAAEHVVSSSSTSSDPELGAHKNISHQQKVVNKSAHHKSKPSRCFHERFATAIADSERCPDACPYFAEIRDNNKRLSCTFQCVPEEGCGRNLTNPLAFVPDKDRGFCRPCSVTGCKRCDRSVRADRCAECNTKSGFTMRDGKCVFRYSLRARGAIVLFSGLLAVVVYILVWYFSLAFYREHVNVLEEQRGLEFRTATKLVIPTHLAPKEQFSERQLWPLNTNTLKVDVAGPGSVLFFRFQMFILVWALTLLLLWVAFARATVPDIMTAGKQYASTPRGVCKVLHESRQHHETASAVNVAFLAVAYVVSFTLCVAFASWQCHTFHNLNSLYSTHGDFAACLKGLPPISGKEMLEDILKETIQEATIQEVIGVSVAWDMTHEIDRVKTLLEEQVIQRDPSAWGSSENEDTAIVFVTDKGKNAREAAEPEEVKSKKKNNKKKKSEDSKAAAQPEDVKEGDAKAAAEEKEANEPAEVEVATQKEVTETDKAGQQNMFKFISSEFIPVKRHRALRFLDRIILVNVFGIDLEPDDEYHTREARSSVTLPPSEHPADEDQQCLSDMTPEDLCKSLTSTPYAWVVFGTEQARDAALEANISFRGEDLTLETWAAEPQSVLWENFGIPRDEVKYRILRSVGFITTCLLAWACVLYLPYGAYLSSFSYENGDAPSAIVGQALSAFLLLGNIILYNVCSEASVRVGFLLFEDKESLYTITYTIAVMVNIILDCAVNGFVSYQMAVSSRSRTYDGKLIAELEDFPHIFQSFEVQRQLGMQFWTYLWPWMFFVPFLGEMIFANQVPLHLARLVVRTFPHIRDYQAQRTLQILVPMDAGRYADVLLNICVATLVFFMPSGYIAGIFITLVASHIFIFCFDHYRVLRCVPSFTLSSSAIDDFVGYMCMIPCVVILLALVFESMGEVCDVEKDY
eukprot:TRINITY_DN11951_c0_g1_i4.p1 TRINITY_DN11951_c0_g1~~TRINITY_DN11951_c0_g1_i4.p1  ORF type:complete len:1101 (+),score=168.31 TRINITY_DN11951_c0_g1_i4:81-3383(+)